MMRLTMACTLAALAGTASAQDVVPQGDEREAKLTLDIRGSYATETDFDDEGEYSVGRFGAGLTYAMPVWDESTLTFGLDVVRSEYDFTDAVNLGGGGDPMDGGTTFGLNVAIAHPIDDEFSFVGGVGVLFSGEDGADFGESAMAQGFAGVGWNVSEDLSLTLGLAVRDRLEDDARVIPLIGVEWQINDEFRLTTSGAGDVLAEPGGQGLGLVYSGYEDLDLVVGFSYSANEFRLDEDGPIADGVLRDDRFILGVGVAWEPSENISATFGIGSVIYSEIETLTDNGDSIGDEEADPAGFITGSVSILF